MIKFMYITVAEIYNQLYCFKLGNLVFKKLMFYTVKKNFNLLIFFYNHKHRVSLFSQFIRFITCHHLHTKIYFTKKFINLHKKVLFGTKRFKHSTHTWNKFLKQKQNRIKHSCMQISTF